MSINPFPLSRPAFLYVRTAAFLLCLSALSTAQDTDAEKAIRQSNQTLEASAGSGTALTSATRVRLAARHERLIELFTTNPEKARSIALSAKTRAWLLKADPTYAALIEADQPLTGQLVSATADDFVHHTSTKHYTLHGFTADRGLSFTTIPAHLDRMVGHQVTVTGLSIPEMVAAETIREASRSESNAVVIAEAPAGAALQANVASTVATPLPFTGSGVPPGSATALGTTLGNQTTAVLILKLAGSTATFPTGYDQQSFYNQMFNGPATPNIAAFMKEGSYGQTTVSADIYGPITIAGSYNCNTVDAMATAAVTATAASIDYTKYNHIAFIFPVASCYFGGLANNGEQTPTALIPHQYSYIWISITPSFDLTPFFVNFAWLATNHEFGHNLNLNHSNSIDFGPLSLGPIDYVSVNPGTVTPGGHGPAESESASAPLALLATPVVAAAPPSGSTNITAVNTEYGEKFANMGDGQATFNAQHATKELAWIPASGTVDVTSSGSFTLSPTETSSGLRSLHVLRDPTSSSWVWVEFHQPIGVYTPLAFTVAPYNVSNDVLSGAQLHYQDGFAEQQHTLLMDMSPSATPNDFFHSNLTPSNSWSDAFSLLTITTGVQSGNSLGISVSYDTPCAKVSLNSGTVPAPGAAGSVTLTAPSTCSWSVSSNASWITFSGTTTGTGNGTVNFVASANTSVTQRNTYITAQRQSLPIVQAGTAITLLNRTPVTVPAGTSVPLVFNLLDALGQADISQINITINGNTNPDCIVTASANGDTTDIDLTLMTNGVNAPYQTTGIGTALSNAYCTIDVAKSSYTAQGNAATLTLMASFPASFAGVHNVQAVSYGAQNGTTIPLSYVNVTNSGTGSSTVAISPASASAGSVGSTVPFTITGVHTLFTAKSSVQVAGAGVSVNNVNFVDAGTLTGNLTVSPSATPGVRAVTISSGSEKDATVFTVNAALAISPASGVKGSTVPVAITGANAGFTTASTVTVSGTRVQARNVTYLSATELTLKIVIDSDADSDVRTVTVTTGSQTSSATFTVVPADIGHVVASPATGNEGDTVFVTFTGTGTSFSDATTVSIPGTDIAIRDISVLSSTQMTVKFKIAASAPAGARVVKITTGTQIVKGSFTVTNYAPTTTTISAAPAKIEETQATTLTVKVAPASGTGTPTGYVSFLEKKDGGLETILGTVALSNASASLPLSNQTVGVHTFYAQYLGDNAAFAASNSTVNAKVTVTADPGTKVLAETATLQQLDDGSYEAIVTIANSGTGTAKGVTMTTATLAGVAAVQSLPLALADIAPAGSISALFGFPANAGAPGTATVLRFAGTYTGGNFAGSVRVKLPSAPSNSASVQ